jgi:prephenate dehydratase
MKRVLIQGVEGAFHEVAARTFYQKDDIEIVPALSFEVLVDSLENNADINAALMAIENTLAGSLMSNYRLLNKSALVISGEIHLRITQNLLALPGTQLEDITEVYSHPIAIAQCRDFFRQYPHIRLIETEDTALSAKNLRTHRQVNAAAIAGSLAASMYDLNILEQGIETNKQNFTRFLVLERKNDAQLVVDADKVSLSFSIDHEVGSLHKVLAVLAAYQANLSKIQSAPIIGKPWEYLFFIDFITTGDLPWQFAVEAIRPITRDLSVLGAYKQGIQKL